MLGGEGREQLRIAVVPRGRVVEGTQEALRRLGGSRGVEIHAKCGQDLGDVTFETRPFGRRDVAPRRAVARVPRKDDGFFWFHTFS